MTIDVAKILEKSGLDQKEVAAILFPNNLHAVRSIQRVMHGKAELNADQVKALSRISGIPIEEMYHGTGRWYQRGNLNGQLELRRDDVRVIIDPASWITTIYKNNVEIQDILITPGITSLRDFIKTINEKIDEYIQNRNDVRPNESKYRGSDDYLNQGDS